MKLADIIKLKKIVEAQKRQDELRYKTRQRAQQALVDAADDDLKTAANIALAQTDDVKPSDLNNLEARADFLRQRAQERQRQAEAMSDALAHERKQLEASLRKDIALETIEKDLTEQARKRAQNLDEQRREQFSQLLSSAKRASQ